MKVLAITCGRKNGNTDILAKNVLLGVLDADASAEVEMIRLPDIHIKPCTGCESCTMRVLSEGTGKCMITGDDMEWVGQKLLGADGYVMAAPIYDLMPPGPFITFLNREVGFNAMHRADMRQKARFGTAIALGGSDWINLGIPIVEFALKQYAGHDVTLVDCMSVPFVPAKSAILLDEEPLERAREAGKNMVRAYRGERIPCRRDHLRQTVEKYKTFLLHGHSPSSPVCPDCGSSLFESRGGMRGACVMCDSTGIFAIDQGEFRFIPDPESSDMNRDTLLGSQDHMRIIADGHQKAAENISLIQERLCSYRDFEPLVMP